MQKEMAQLEEKQPWDVIPLDAVPEGANILDSVWAFKRKRFPDGRVRKLKARFCVRGDQQIEGVDFFDTFAPVVAWSTVRLLLILSVILGLATKQVDYTLAFVQADLDDEVYVRMPKLFEQPGHVFKLKKSVYGLRQAPLNFFLSLKDGLEARGFVQSAYDPCLFVSETVICLCYVDDCLFFSKDSANIDAVIESLRRPEPTSFDLNIEDDVAGFLGILMKKKDDGSIELIQTGLIDRILKVMALEDSHEKFTPSDVKPLGKDEGGDPCSEPWSYASVVGMMMYLASNSRPDIAYAVHSCASFTHCPKRTHEKALKRIARYLKGTKERGMIIRPTADLSMDLFVDADFAGLWSSENPDDSMSVKSRTGYIITIGGTPVVWSSKLQTEIALSTCEAEYIALSTAMRALLPLRQLFHSLAATMNIARDEITKVCAVWEDNNAALKLANAQFPNMTPRTKHIAIKYHWFKSHIQEGEIEVRPIDTKVQKADIFTKGIAKKEFEEKRSMIMEW
jgi:histone deacetylase 1/2